MGSITAILLNLLFNVWGERGNLVTKVLPTPRHDDVLSIDQVNQFDAARFVETFSPLFQGTEWVAERAFPARPFQDVYDLRRAFHDAMFSADPERQLALIQAYPDLASRDLHGRRAPRAPRSTRPSRASTGSPMTSTSRSTSSPRATARSSGSR